MTPRLKQETLITLVEKARTGDCAERTCKADRTAYSQIFQQFQDLAVGYAYSILRNFFARNNKQSIFVCCRCIHRVL